MWRSLGPRSKRGQGRQRPSDGAPRWLVSVAPCSGHLYVNEVEASLKWIITIVGILGRGGRKLRNANAIRKQARALRSRRGRRSRPQTPRPRLRRFGAPAERSCGGGSSRSPPWWPPPPAGSPFIYPSKGPGPRDGRPCPPRRPVHPSPRPPDHAPPRARPRAASRTPGRPAARPHPHR